MVFLHRRLERLTLTLNLLFPLLLGVCDELIDGMRAIGINFDQAVNAIGVLGEYWARRGLGRLLDNPFWPWP